VEPLLIMVLLVIPGILAWAFQALSVRGAVREASVPGDYAADLPPISILKPLRGLDDNLFQNLESFCRLDYPRYEILFCLQHQNDLARRVVQKIIEKYPERELRIIIEPCTAGLNPKVNNLIPAYRASSYEHILISDSNVSVRPGYLREIVRRIGDPSVGLVSNLIRGRGGRTLGSLFENLHLNSFVMGSVCFLDRFMHTPCVIGKSMLMRKKDLEAVGGLRAFKDVLAEDYIIGRQMHRQGKKVVLSSHMIDNVNDYWSIGRFLNRHTRWGKLRWQIGGFRYLSEILTNAVFMSWIPTLIWGASAPTLAFGLSVSALKSLYDFLLGRRIGSDLATGAYLLSPLKDLVIGIIWFVPMLSSSVEWRGNRYLIGKDSRLSPVPVSIRPSLRHRLTAVIRARLA